MKDEKGFVEIVLIIVFIVFLILIVSLIGSMIYQNVSYGEKEGRIINKYYKDPYTTTTYVMSGKVMIPISNHHSESWNFELQKEVDGKNKTTTVEVSQDIYNQYDIGEYFKESK